MSKDTYSVAIVGCGSMGVEMLFDKSIPFTYSFAGAVLKNRRTRLVALIDTDQNKRFNIHRRLVNEGYTEEIIFLYDTLEQAVISLAKHGIPIDIVCCAAGPQVNYEIIRQAEKFGVKGFYCEKPLTLSLSLADELVEIEKKSSVKFQANYLRNFDAFHLNVLDFIRQGGIGDLLTVRILYKGGIIAVAPHGFALLGLLLGKPLAVSGCYSPLLNTRCLADPNVDGIILYRFKDRHINVSLMATGRGEIENNTYLFELEFTGTKGRISILESGGRVRYERMEPSRIFGPIGELMPYETANIPLKLRADGPKEFMIEGLQSLMAAIDNNTSANCSLELARDAEEIAHALAFSAERERPITLPLADRSHAFADTKSGVKFLKQEAGIEN